MFISYMVGSLEAKAEAVIMHHEGVCDLRDLQLRILLYPFDAFLDFELLGLIKLWNSFLSQAG